MDKDASGKLSDIKQVQEVRWRFESPTKVIRAGWDG